MDFEHLVERGRSLARLVYAKRKTHGFTSDEIACYSIQHVYQAYLHSEKFRERTEDPGFVEAALYNGCLRAIEKRRVYRQDDALEHCEINDWEESGPTGTVDYIGHILDGCNFNWASKKTGYAIAEYHDLAMKSFFDAFDHNFKEMINILTLQTAKVVLMEIFSPSDAMQRWLEAESHRVAGTAFGVKINYRAFMAVYGMSQNQYDVALRHIRRKLSNTGHLGAVRGGLPGFGDVNESSFKNYKNAKTI